MTTIQFEILNNLLKYKDNPPLSENNNARQSLIKFFYQIKLNWDNYQLGKSICSVTTNWNIQKETFIIRYGVSEVENGRQYKFRPVLAALFYKYLISVNPTTDLNHQIKEAFNIEKQHKINARNYFKGQCQCPNKEPINKKNYQQYYFVQPRKYIGNK